MYTNFITWIDLLLVPIYYLVLHSVLVYVKKRHHKDPLYQNYLLKGFAFKSFFAIFYAMLAYYYYGFGDTLTYFRDALQAKAQIHSIQDFFDVMSMEPKTAKKTFDLIAGSTESGWFIERLALIIAYLSFDRVLVATLIFAAIAYTGMFKMFETFASVMPEWRTRVALIVLFFPSVAMYGSGILKDTLCIGAMGWLIYAIQQLWSGKHHYVRNILVIIGCVIIIAILKVYILAAFVPSFFLFLLMKATKKIKSPLFKSMVIPVLVAMIFLTYFAFSEAIDNKLGNYAVEKLLDTVQDQQKSYLTAEESAAGSTFDIGGFDPSFSGLVGKAPQGIVTTLFRPFIWETRKPLMLFSALESLFILLFTIYVLVKAGVLRFFKILFSNPFIFLCVSYSLVFATLVGLSTLNFGTLARYRIPVIPFYLTGILAILYEYRLSTRKKPHENTA